jgi:16S rRNA (guanine966-N2)-methyltransferase
LRVVGGSAKGRRLGVPTGLDARPTSDLIRGAVFNMLEARFGIEGADVVDLCCGTGALGIEALSRGAASCRFVDSSVPALAAARENLAAVGLGSANVTFERTDAVRWALGLSPDADIDVVLADPPYGWEEWAALQTALRGKVGVLVGEAERLIEPEDGWDRRKDLRHGGTVVTVLVARARSSDE